MVKVAVAKCESYDDDLVLNAVKQALKDADIRLPSGKKVLVKPNCLGAYAPEMAITTHPSVIKAVVELFKEKNCEVVIGESCGLAHRSNTVKALIESGIQQVADELGIKTLPFEKGKIKQIDIKGHKVGIAEAATKFDIIVNIAKLKTHELMKFTGAVKNIFGFVVGARKSYFHAVFPRPEALAGFLVDLYEVVTPPINIMDGIIGLEGNGPGTGGMPRQTGVLLASKNAVALDIVASGIIGYEPLSVPTNKIAADRKLVAERITVVGEKVSIDYEKPAAIITKMPEFILKRFSKACIHYPHIIPEKCTKCGACVEVCPQKAIKNFIVDKNKCITCYCCQEFCQSNAIELRMGLFGQLLLQIAVLKNKLLSRKKKG